MTGPRTYAAAALALALSACAAPDYHRPDVQTPVAWKLEPPWRESSPRDTLDKGQWWERFGDPTLSALEQKVLASNTSLEAATQRLEQARATARAAEAGLFPQIGVGARTSKLRSSANRPLTNYSQSVYSTVQPDNVVGLTVSYEADLAGRVHSAISGAQASAQQAAADFANTRLMLTAELASSYVNLRELDIELDVLRKSIDLQRRALELITSRHDLGAASGLEVAQQQGVLDSTLTQVDVLAKSRAQYEHAIATLVGTPAPEFSLPAQVRDMTPPAIPLGIPSDVLERRPDVASAERAMAAANAQIGVARAAFFPSIMLTPTTAGYESRDLTTLFNAPSLIWSFGISATQILFDGGRRRANVDFANAGYQAAVANYKTRVLTAMQEVQDGISGLAALERASEQSQRAVASAQRVLDMANARYEGGATTYLDVITAQQSLLSAQRQRAQLLGQRLLTSVFLVKALGGDWAGPQATPTETTVAIKGAAATAAAR